MRFARVRAGTELLAAALLGAGFPGLLLAAALPSLWLFTAAAAASYLAEVWLHHRGVPLLKVLGRIRAGISLRFLARELTVVLLVARSDLGTGTALLAGTTTFLLFHGLQVSHAAVLGLLRKRRQLPYATRNIDLSGVHIGDSPPAVLIRRASEKMLGLDVFAAAGLVLATATGKSGYALAGCATTIGLAAVYVAALAPWLRQSRCPAETVLAREYLDAWLHEYRPTTVLYFSGSRESAYQVAMWLDALASYGGRPLVILRERALLPQLPLTAVPVMCVPSSVHLMNLDLSSVRVALYPANVSKNLHLLRVPTIRHVFVGHGDSDKTASVNPYVKAYDEVWTAGRAGRDRFAAADIGVRDEDIVEVGRPQLRAIQRAGDAGKPPAHPSPDSVEAGSFRPPPPTVLYAPTWEGWTDEPGNTSLVAAGENIVRTLLAAEPPVRLVYKPHPLTGSRSPAARAAHQRIVALIETATAMRSRRFTGAVAAIDGTGPAGAGHTAAKLARIEAQLARLAKQGRPGADEAERSRDTLVTPGDLAEADRLQAAWSDTYWSGMPWWQHSTVTGDRPDLYDCFNHSELLVADISSVVSDYIASGKPYAIANTTGLAAAEFRRRNPTARAAYLLGRDGSQLAEVLASLPADGPDPLAKTRDELREYLLGPAEATPGSRFCAALKDTAARANARAATLAKGASELLTRAGQQREAAQ